MNFLSYHYMNVLYTYRSDITLETFVISIWVDVVSIGELLCFADFIQMIYAITWSVERLLYKFPEKSGRGFASQVFDLILRSAPEHTKMEWFFYGIFTAFMPIKWCSVWYFFHTGSYPLKSELFSSDLFPLYYKCLPELIDNFF